MKKSPALTLIWTNSPSAKAHSMKRHVSYIIINVRGKQSSQVPLHNSWANGIIGAPGEGGCGAILYQWPLSRLFLLLPLCWGLCNIVIQQSFIFYSSKVQPHYGPISGLKIEPCWCLRIVPEQSDGFQRSCYVKWTYQWDSLVHANNHATSSLVSRKVTVNHTKQR